MNRQDEVNQLKTIVADADKLNHINQVKDCLLNKNFQYLDQANKERLIFQEAIIFLNYRKTGEDILSYLIFDYKVSENNSINAVDRELLDVEKAEKMFAIRRKSEQLASELTEELAPNSDKPSKKPKV